MPIMDGFSALKKIKILEESQHKEKIDIMALTAHVTEDIKQKIKISGFDHYLTKPISRIDLYNFLNINLSKKKS